VSKTIVLHYPHASSFVHSYSRNRANHIACFLDYGIKDGERTILIERSCTWCGCGRSKYNFVWYKHELQKRMCEKVKAKSVHES
jgi:hypothetical protein